MTDAQKNAVLVRFCGGEDVSSIAHHLVVPRMRVEAVIREAIAQLIRERGQVQPGEVVTLHG